MAKKSERKIIYVYADWVGLNGPSLVGTLAAELVRGAEVFSFSYDKNWLEQKQAQNLDPDLQMFSGAQYASEGKTNFGIFTDSCPDRWGRILMKKREAILARIANKQAKKLYESDFLLGVNDLSRMGALRFKLSQEGEFLNNRSSDSASLNVPHYVPRWTRLRELQQASLNIEGDDAENSAEYLKWLNMLISPGSSLGGARPKASVLSEDDELWIAKFPSRFDDVNVGGWEMVAYKIAIEAGVEMSESKVEQIASDVRNENFCFLTKRFDRQQDGRIHFASAMTCLAKVDGDDHSRELSYLDLAEYIVRSSANVEKDLEQLWRRIVLNIFISNVDDHLRNHGFLLDESGWSLSPAFDINPVADGNGLKLNISQDDNSQDIELALSVIGYFRISASKASAIVEEVRSAALKWRQHANDLGISRQKQDLMARAFRLL